jgi:ribosomal protein S18 acetylase RimI-like enzyme
MRSQGAALAPRTWASLPQPSEKLRALSALFRMSTSASSSASSPGAAVRAAIVVREGPADDIAAWADEECERFSQSATGAKTGYTHHLVIAKDRATGAIVGVVQGESLWGGASVSRLVVDKAWRRKHGVGRALLASMLESARDGPAQARVAHVCTLDFEAPRYYPRLGFRLDHELHGIQRGRSIHYLSLPDAKLRPVPPEEDKHHSAAFALETLQPLPHDTATVESVCTYEDQVVSAAAAAHTFLNEKFNDYSIEAVGATSGYSAFALAATTPAGERVGAVTGLVYWGVLVVSSLVVSETHRGEGVGSQLLNAALKLGVEKDCSMCVVETMSFQAPAFYIRNGFTRVGRVGGFRDGVELLRFSKAIVAHNYNKK